VSLLSRAHPANISHVYPMLVPISFDSLLPPPALGRSPLTPSSWMISFHSLHRLLDDLL